MLYDGEEVALAADGTYTFTTDGEIHSVTINKVAEVYDGKYTLIPANGETVESLETIVIAFDDATTASLVEGMEGDMMLMSGNNYAAWGFEVNAVEDAEHPTFEIKPQMTPSVDGTYRFYIPEGVFTIDGKTNPEIMAIFNMETPVAKFSTASILSMRRFSHRRKAIILPLSSRMANRLPSTTTTPTSHSCLMTRLWSTALISRFTPKATIWCSSTCSVKTSLARPVA